MLVPTEPKIYHIVHVDRLASIIADSHLWSDAEARRRGVGGTTIGMSSIKQARLMKALNSRSGLRVGDCVPFNLCPRSVMLYVIYMRNHHELEYRGGQGPIIHLEADMRESVAWATVNEKRWAFTPSNARANYAEDYSDLRKLNQLDWDAIQANDWRGHSEGKQAEFLVEDSFPWSLIAHIGVRSAEVRNRVMQTLQASSHCPPVEIKPDWYY